MIDQLDNEHRARQQVGLDQDQMLADLGQSIADREQALADQEAARIRNATLSGQSEFAVTDQDDKVALTRLRHKGGELAETQVRHESRQTQIDQAQRAADSHQDVLDAQQLVLDSVPGSDKLTLQRRLLAARDRANAASRRAEAASLRLHAASTPTAVGGDKDRAVVEPQQRK